MGKALKFDGGKIDNLTAQLGADLPGGNVNRTIELWAKFTGESSWTSCPRPVLSCTTGGRAVWAKAGAATQTVPTDAISIASVSPMGLARLRIIYSPRPEPRSQCCRAKW